MLKKVLPLEDSISVDTYYTNHGAT